MYPTVPIAKSATKNIHITYFALLKNLNNLSLNFLGIKLSAIIGILVAIIIYGLAIIALKIFEKDEIYMIPYGTKIYKFLTKVKIYK